MSRFALRVMTLLLVSTALAVGVNLARSDEHRLPWILDRDGTGRYTKHQLTLDQARTRFEQGVIFLDARPLDQYVEGHIPGAHHFHAEEVLDQAETIMNHIGFEETVIIYCDGGNCGDSDTAYQGMQRIGYDHLYVFKGGWEEWSRPEHGLEVEQGAPPYDYAFEVAASDATAGPADVP